MEEEKKINEIEKPKLDKRKQFLNIAFILIVFVGIFTYMIRAEGIDNLAKMITEVDRKWIIAGMVCLF